MSNTAQHTEEFPAILSFWFEEIKPEQWFKKDDAFDQLLTGRFGALIKKAMGGECDAWPSTPDGSLALILLLDQMMRNIYRGTPMAFAGDEKALATCLASIDRSDHQSFTLPKLQFLLMPMMHSEDLAIQDRSLPLFKTCGELTYEFAVKHRDIIARFGRFPHRNIILNRPSSDEEREFLTQPNSSF